jgi:site-specific DNA-cytosine methylase
MGLETGYTAVPGCSDSKRYKACGNAIVRQCAEAIMFGIAENYKFEERQKEKNQKND